jgi:hypothetical protein
MLAVFYKKTKKIRKIKIKSKSKIDKELKYKTRKRWAKVKLS